MDNQDEQIQMNQNNNQPDNDNRNQGFFDRITSKEVLIISNDFFPSTLIIGFILYALYDTEKFCDNNFQLIFKASVIVYSTFILKSIIHVIFISTNTSNNETQKLSLTSFNYIAHFAYYCGVVFAYLIYKSRPEECFISNTFPTILLFCLVLIGIINISRHLLNFLMLLLCFPIMVYYFLRNPNGFYSNFGIDPEIVENLPLVKATATQVTPCVICSEMILEDDDILILRCPGRHYYHGTCIKKWLVHKVNCPMCRAENVL